MRIIHTSDWHLGRTLHGVDLHAYHAQYFEHLIELVRAESVDAVLVSGDIYDRAIPPVDSVDLLSDTLQRLSEHAHVVLTPGNHDSAVRLGFGSGLMRANLHIQAKVRNIATPISLHGKDGEQVRIFGIPYLDPDASRNALQHCCASDASQPNELLAEPATERRGQSAPDSTQATIGRSHESVMNAAMGLIRNQINGADSTTKAANIVMAHAFVVGGEASESERDIRVGGVDSVPAGVFAGVDYVALGHLHGAQNVKVPNSVARYSGSPLAFSFSEMNHKKSSALMEIRDGQLVSQPELIAAPVPRKLSEVTGSMADLLGSKGDPLVNDWLRVYVTDPQRPQEMNRRLKTRFPHALVMQHTPEGLERKARQAIKVNAQTDPAQVASQFVEDVTSTAPTPAEMDVLQTALDLARAMDRSE